MKRALSALAVLSALLLCAPDADAKKPRKSGAPASQGARASYLDWISVVELDGELSADGRPVQAGFFAAAGTKLELSAGGRAVFRLGKDDASEGAVEIRGPASFRIDGGRQSGFDLVRGRLLAALPSLKSPFHVRARGLVAAVRGTEFYIDLAGHNDLYLCVCSGTVDVTDNLPRGYRRTVKGEHHAGVGYHRTGGSTLESDHEMEGHSDEDLAALRAFVSNSK